MDAPTAMAVVCLLVVLVLLRAGVAELLAVVPEADVERVPVAGLVRPRVVVVLVVVVGVVLVLVVLVLVVGTMGVTADESHVAEARHKPSSTSSSSSPVTS